MGPIFTESDLRWLKFLVALGIVALVVGGFVLGRVVHLPSVSVNWGAP
jgi:Ni,Fe-hydrogenase I cytochrome b subunit